MPHLAHPDDFPYGWPSEGDFPEGRDTTPYCPACGHADYTHRWYYRCTGTAQQPDCICLFTPSEVCTRAERKTPEKYRLDLDPIAWSNRNQ
jgi:hypothetical protein